MARRTIKLWQLLLAGPFLLWVGVHEYNRLDAFEDSGGTIYVDRLTHLFYSLGGKNAVLVIWLGFGGFYLWAVWKYFQVQRESQHKLDELAAREAVLQARKAGRAPTAPPRDPARPAPPRIGDDPFRNPPAQAPIAVVNTAAPPRAAPLAAGDPDDKPKFLG